MKSQCAFALVSFDASHPSQPVRSFPGARLPAWLLLAALALQLVIGVSMVLKSFPLWLASLHSAAAALLLLATLALLRSLGRR